MEETWIRTRPRRLLLRALGRKLARAIPAPTWDRVLPLALTLLCTIHVRAAGADGSAEPFPVPRIDYAPRHYLCYRASEALSIDGRTDEQAWRLAPETEAFVDIEGSLKPLPRYETRAKMLWDQNYFYISAVLEEPDLWGTLVERDAIIYRDHDFELFIDPDADTHGYYELEINALGTVWDLLLLKPYRDGGPAVNAWDIRGLKTAVDLQGTCNQPADRDHSWSIEIALPWSVLAECAHRPAPPRDGDQWKVNFSRVEWRLDVRDGQYVKRKDPATGRDLPEDNWVWSPQGLIAMHYPEMWGWVQFTERSVGAEPAVWVEPPGDAAAWALRQLYYAERNYHNRHGRFSSILDELGPSLPSDPGVRWPPEIDATRDRFQIRLFDAGRKNFYRISQDGRLESEPVSEAEEQEPK